MFGFLKNLIGERRARPVAEELPPPPGLGSDGLPKAAPPPAPEPSPAANAAITANTVPRPSAPKNTPRPIEPTGDAPAKTHGSHAGRVLLPLKAITDKFPASLKAALAAEPNAGTQISLKLDDLLPQLATGRVEVSLGQLRSAAPLGTFVDDTSRDGEPTTIPLSELLPRIDSGLLQNRSQQKIEVPEDIDTPFRKQSESGTTTRLIPSPSPAATRASAPGERDLNLNQAPGIEAPSDIQALFAPKKNAPPEPPPVRPLPVAPPEPQRPSRHEGGASGGAFPSPEASRAASGPLPIKLSLAPSASQTLSGQISTPTPPSAPSPAISIPAAPPVSLAPTDSAATPQSPGAGLSRRQPIVDAPMPTLKPGTRAIPSPTAPLSTPAPIRPSGTGGLSFPTSQPPPPSSPAASSSFAATSGHDEVVAIPLSAVNQGWPEAIREETASMAASATIEYPKSELASALKQGKVAVRWSTLRCWIRPAEGFPSSSLYDDAVVELPLPVVAPLFMAKAAPASAARKVIVDESIPALFQPASAVPPEPRASGSPGGYGGSARPMVDPAPPGSGAFAARDAAPTAATTGAGAGALGAEGRLPSVLIERACALRGVGGAVVALADGLLVAASLPKEFSAETIAAFLPQVFSRLEQAAGSMKIGEVQHLSFNAADRTWQIWRAGELFFAAISTPNEMLPGAQLKIIAAQLARQTRG